MTHEELDQAKPEGHEGHLGAEVMPKERPRQLPPAVRDHSSHLPYVIKAMIWVVVVFE
jgi:hypothetical protein